MSGTYFWGPQFLATKNIEKSDFIRACDLIMEKYKEIYPDSDPKLEMIPVSKMTIQIDKIFRRIKLFVVDDEGFPYQDIYNTFENEFEQEYSSIFIEKNKNIGTFIESFEEKWTQIESDILIDSFKMIGFEISEPSKKEELDEDLDKYMNLFYPK